MNYKNIIRSRKFRILILSFFNWVPDRIMVPFQYKIHTGRTLDKVNPKRFTEKIQVYKMTYRNPQMLRCTDKYEVRKVVEEIGLSEILIPLIGVFDKPSDINFDNLPNEFVAKTTDGGGGNQVLICRDKTKLKSNEFFKQLEEWMRIPSARMQEAEWAYENGYPRRIIIERLIKSGGLKDLPDYKFFCFNGVPKYCQLIDNRSTKETIDFYDMEWKHQDFVGLNPLCKNSGKIVPKPKKFEILKEYAAKLSKGYPFVRVDLYDTEAWCIFWRTNILSGERFWTFYTRCMGL